MPPSEMTATSVVPPPMSTIMFPVGSATGSPAPMAAAIGSSIRKALRAPADSVASSTARFSTPVTPEGTQTTTRGCAQRFWCTFWMKWRSICSVTSKSAITPSFSGRMALMLPGRAPEHPLGLDPDRVHLAAALVDRHHGGLREHDAAPADVHQRVGRPEVDGHVTSAEPGQVAPEPDRSPPRCDGPRACETEDSTQIGAGQCTPSRWDRGNRTLRCGRPPRRGSAGPAGRDVGGGG